MDHRWDDSTLQDRSARDERERFASGRIARDLEVERRDRQLEAEQAQAAQRTCVTDMSPWSIGMSFHDQRDLYTRNASIDEDGYGVGSSHHPDEGSYAYPREFHPGFFVVREGDASLFEREAWPWLNYKSPHDDPYFAHLHAREREHPSALWPRIKASAAELTGWWTRAVHRPAATTSSGAHAPDARIERDVFSALRRRADLDPSDIDVQVRAASVTLGGTVRDRREKRLAKEVCEAVSGVRSVHNRLKIRRHDPTDANLALSLAFVLVG